MGPRTIVQWHPPPPHPPVTHTTQAAALVILVVGVVLPIIHFSLFLYNRLLFRKNVGFFGRAPFLPTTRAYGAAAAATTALASSPSSPGRDDRRPLLPN